MRFGARSTDGRRAGGRLVRRLAVLAGALLVTMIAVPSAQAGQASPATPIGPGDGGIYSVLFNGATGQCADLPNFGSVGVNTPVTQYQCRYNINDDNQVWNIYLTRTTSSGLYLYQFQNVKSGLCLDLPNYGTVAAGTHVSVYNCAANSSLDNQEWWFELITQAGGYNYYLIHNAANPGLCLDVANWAHDGTDQASGLPLTVYNCTDPTWGYDDHLWALPGYTS